MPRSPLQADLGVLEAGPDLVVGDRERALLADVIGIGGERRRAAARGTRRAAAGAVV